MLDVALGSVLAGWGMLVMCGLPSVKRQGAALPDLAAPNRHPACAHIGKFAPDEIAENDQVEQKNEPDRNTPSDIPHGLILCCTATRLLLLQAGAELNLGRRGKSLQSRRDHSSPGTILQRRMRTTCRC
jgi:hypothetical protein